EPVSHAEKASARQHRVGDAARGNIDHEFLDLAEIFAGPVDDVVAFERARRHYLRPGAAVARAATADDLGAAARGATLGRGYGCAGCHAIISFRLVERG